MLRGGGSRVFDTLDDKMGRDKTIPAARWNRARNQRVLGELEKQEGLAATLEDEVVRLVLEQSYARVLQNLSLREKIQEMKVAHEHEVHRDD